ncbi:hypothetical protein FACS189483_06620 [Spirochaetia bacterium]|nr:hypothetical protein FACS189483_06620 [Spirochaetia bacterium]
MDKKTRRLHQAAYCYDYDHALDALDDVDFEAEATRIGNRSDALDLCETPGLLHLLSGSEKLPEFKEI